MMKIESVSARPDRAGRYPVKLSDGSVLRLYRQTVEDFGLYSGLELSDKQMADLRTAAGAMSAKMRAVRIVAASSVSKSDLEQRLVHKGEDPEQAREAVAWMADMDLLDDRRTAEQIVHRCIGKGYGIARAKQALYEKRIPKQYWDEALVDYPDQMETIVSFLQTRLNSRSNRREIQKATEALVRKGHSYSLIRKGLSQMMLDSEDFPED